MDRRIVSAFLGLCLVGGVSTLCQAQPRIGAPSSPQQPQQQPQQQPAQPSQGGLITHITPDDTAKLLEKAGYKEVEVYQTSAGRRHVKAKLGALPVHALHANCDASGCRSISFATFFGKQPNVDWKYINAWHNAWRFTRLYRNDQGDLVFDMDLHLYNGATPDYIQQAATLYAQLLNKLLDFRPTQ